MNDPATDIDALRERHDAFRRRGLSLNMERGQPADANLDLSLPMLTAVGPDDFVTDAGVDVRNYPGGVDPHDRTLRLAPTRPPLDDVRQAMEVVANCIALASAELEAGRV